MESAIDRFGRVVIPKAIRDHLGLKPGMVLKVEEHDHEVLLKITEHEPQIKSIEGILVFTGKPTANIESAIHQFRNEQIKRKGGI